MGKVTASANCEAENNRVQQHAWQSAGEPCRLSLIQPLSPTSCYLSYGRKLTIGVLRRTASCRHDCRRIGVVRRDATNLRLAPLKA